MLENNTKQSRIARCHFFLFLFLFLFFSFFPKLTRFAQTKPTLPLLKISYTLLSLELGINLKAKHTLEQTGRRLLLGALFATTQTKQLRLRLNSTQLKADRSHSNLGLTPTEFPSWFWT